MQSVKQEAVNTSFKVIGLTRLEPESTAPEADALTTRPFDGNCDKFEMFFILTIVAL